MDEISLTTTLPFSTDAALRRSFMLLDAPVRGNIRFGKLLEVLDKLAEEQALAYVRRAYPAARVVTAAVDRIQVLAPADIDRDLVFRARINFVGRTSLEVGIRVEHPADASRPAAHIASCYFTMVARDEAETASLDIPGFTPQDALSEARWAKAIERREDRKRDLQAAAEPPTREEFDLLQGLHAAQEAPGFNGLRAGDLSTSGWERMYPEQENVPKKIFGGYLIRKAYEQSSICAELVAPDRPIIVSVNRINFAQPVRMGDKLHFQTRVIHSEGNSLCVEADILRVGQDHGRAALSNTCVFTFVNVDDALRPRPVPLVHPATYREDAAFLAAHRRRAAYLAWKAEGKP
ncbi:MAG TPA: hotdog domain-containing protein [Holophagaceae bacterium]|jgi:acyl-CoA hydrolase|nr:hotdog domain-containing protein [Holophagaceae bacterium]